MKIIIHSCWMYYPKDAFKGNGKIYTEEAKVAEYERLIGRLYAKIDLLERAYESMKQQVAEDQKKVNWG